MSAGIVFIILLTFIIILSVTLTHHSGGGGNDDSAQANAALDLALQSVLTQSATSGQIASTTATLNPKTLNNADIGSMLLASLGSDVVQVDSVTLLKANQGLPSWVAPEVNEMLNAALASRIMLGTADLFNGLVTDVNCLFSLFFRPNEQRYNNATMRFAIQCQLPDHFSPSSLNLLSLPSLENPGATSWLNNFDLAGNVSVIATNGWWTDAAAGSSQVTRGAQARGIQDTLVSQAKGLGQGVVIANFLDAGLTVMASAALAQNANPNYLGNLNKMLRTGLSTMPTFRLQFSLPLQFSPGSQTSKPVSFDPTRPVRGKLWLATGALHFSDSVTSSPLPSNLPIDFPSSASAGLVVYVEGFTDAAVTLTFQTVVQFNLSPASSATVSPPYVVAGQWDSHAHTVWLYGGAVPAPTSTWKPFAQATAPVTLSSIVLNISFTETNGALSLTRATLQASVLFKYVTNPVIAMGEFSPSGVLVIISATDTGNLIQLAQRVDADFVSSSPTFSWLSKNVNIQASQLGFAVSTYPSIFSDILQQTVTAGISIFVEGVTVQPNAFSNKAKLDLINRIDPNFNLDFDLTITLPVFGSTMGQSYTITLSVSDLQLNADIDITNLNFILAAPSDDTAPPLTVSLEATVAYTFGSGSNEQTLFGVDGGSGTTVTFHAAINYDSSVSTLDMQLSTGTWPLPPNWANYMTVQSALIHIIVTFAQPMTVTIATSAQVNFLFWNPVDPNSATPTPTVNVAVILLNADALILSAQSVDLNVIHPNLAGIIGFPPGSVGDLVICTDLLGSITDFSLDGQPITVPDQIRPILDGSLSPPRSILGGLQFFAQSVKLLPGAFDGTLDEANFDDGTTPASSALWDLSLHFPFALDQRWTVGATLDGQSSLTPGSSITLNNAQVLFNVLPYSSPLDAEATASATLGLHLAENPRFSITAAGFVSTANSLFALTGAATAWPSPFGVSWLTIGQTNFQFVAGLNVASQAITSPFKAVVSISTVAKFQNAGNVKVCGFGRNQGAAITVSGITEDLIASTVCSLLGVCTDMGPVFQTTGAGAGSFSLSVSLSSTAFSKNTLNEKFGTPFDFTTDPNVDVNAVTPTSWSLCSQPYAVHAGITVYTTYTIQGILRDTLKLVLNNLDQFFGNGGCQLGVSLPFAGTGGSSVGLTPASVVELTDGQRVQILLDAIRSGNANQHLRSLGLLDDVKTLNIHFDCTDFNYPLSSILTVTGAGISGTPFNLPTPAFTAYLDLSLALPELTEPLTFHVEGDVSTAQVSLSGSMTSEDGWPQPFGLRGLTVYSVGMQLGISASGLSAIGLGFNMMLGSNIMVAFAGSVNLADATQSYFTGTVQSSGTTPISLRDVADTIRIMSSDLIDINDAYLPGPDVLSLTELSITIAAQAGTALNGLAYQPGITIICKANLFGVQLDASIQTVKRAMPWIKPTVMVSDFTVSIAADFDQLNQQALAWVGSILPFQAPQWLSNGKTLCDIVCIHSFSISQFSLLDILSLQKFPTLSMSMSLAGNTVTIGPINFDFEQMALDANSFFNQFKHLFDFSNLCIISSSCPNIEVCNHVGSWHCSSVTSCHSAPIPFLGCF